MQFIWFAIIGGVVGWLAYLQLDGGKTRFHSDILAGITGGILTGLMVAGLKIPATFAGTSATALVLSAVGAVVGVFIERVIRSKRRT